MNRITRALTGAALTALALVFPGAAEAAGLTWTIYHPQGNGASLAAIDARSANDVWTVGLKLGGGVCQYETLVEHWDGSSWMVTPSADVTAANTTLADVAAIGPSDVWAVGRSSCPGIRPARTLAEHWNGTAWSIVPTPNPSPEFDTLSAVAAVSSTDVWAIGSIVQSGTGSGLAMHWDGAGWAVVPMPPVTSSDEPVDASASGPADVWAVGSGPSEGSDQPIALHWNGGQWSSIPVPTPQGAHGFLSGVTAISPTNAWAVGGYRPSGSTLQPLIERWNGSAWRVVAAPNVGDYAALEAVDHAAGVHPQRTQPGGLPRFPQP